ncbi:histidine kinase, partial [Streptomyces sp. NPDC059627]
LGLGLYVVARLAHRHGVRVQLREQKQGGVAAVVVLPQPLLAQAPPAVPTATTTPAGAHAFSLPGADAEVNSNVLYGRATSGDGDLLVTLAEKAVRDADGHGHRHGAAAQGTDEDAVHEQAAPPKPADPEPTARPKAPAETFAETTMELLVPLEPEPGTPKEQAHPADAGAHARPLPAAADGEHAPLGPPAPDHESRTGGAGGNETAEGEAEDPVTSKGLPKRTPKITAPAPPPPQRRHAGHTEPRRR